MTTFEALTEYYGNYDEDGRLISRHGKVEFLTTVKYIDKYLKRGDHRDRRRHGQVFSLFCTAGLPGRCC